MDKIDKVLNDVKDVQFPSIETSLDKLILEAENLFKLLDNTSNFIRLFEKRMNELKAFFCLSHVYYK